MLDESLPTAAAARIDALCLEFEAALKEGRCAGVEGYVRQADPVDRDLLRHELQRIRTDFERYSEPRRDPADVLSHQMISTDPVRTTPSNTGPPRELAQTDVYTTPSSDPDGQNAAAAVLSFDRYEVRGVLGKGGFGLVYRGYDPELRREVAIKVPIRSQEASFSQTEAYIAEARMVAGLDHPGIVPVYDVGRTDGGQCFIVSKYVAGSDLAKWTERQRPDARCAAEIVAQVAEALDHAHQRGLVHRDIKPANILIDESGRPLVGDFGLALCDDSFGHGAEICGTPAYMSPEQAAGQSDRLDARSDIYSLGVVFYELLTGRRPWRQTDPVDVIDEITSGGIRPPRQLDHTIPQELERICLKALAKDVSDRYTTAFDLADDLKQYLIGRAPQPAPVDSIDSTASLSGGQSVGRRRVLALTLAASLLALCGVALTAIGFSPAKPPARFEELALTVAKVQGERAWDDQPDTYSLVNDGQNVAPFLEDRLAPDEAFKLEGRFAAPCAWHLLWLDTRGHWSVPAVQLKKQQEFYYPLDRTMVNVDPADPPGTHLLVIVAGDKPIGEEVLANLSTNPPPSLERLMFRSNSEAATLRGPGGEFETVDSYISSLAGRLPEDQKLVAALFLPTGPVHRRSHTPPFSGPRQRPLVVTSRERGRRALLVGCCQYNDPSIRPLEGPVNDVRLMKEVLVERCGFSPEQITTLAGAAHAGDAPTRANIEREFRRLQAEAQTDDQIVVLLAGHGSQQANQVSDLDDSEPDGLDEIFLPIDVEKWSRTGGTDSSGGVVNAIIDDEINRWTVDIAEKGATVWVIFDFCCAGTAIRGEYQEVPRFVSAVGDLSVPEATLPDTNGHRAAASEGDESRWWVPPNDRIVAFYACEANESEPELALPLARNDVHVQRAKHGLFTYALCCALSQPAAETLTYQDLARDVWLRYRAWGRASPTPVIEGATDRRVLGQRQASTRFRVLRRSGRDGVIDAGELQGLTPGSIVALYPPTAPAGGVPKLSRLSNDEVEARSVDRPTGYARVTDIRPTMARIVPCAYGDVPNSIGVEVGAWCELVYTDFGDMRLSVAIDQKSATRAGPMSAVLTQLAEQLRSLADAPTSVFRVVDEASAADWVIQVRESAIELLPRSAAELADGEPLPLGTPHFLIDEADSAKAIVGLLQRVFRAQNLIKLASSSGNTLPQGRDPLKLKVELLDSQSVPLPNAAVLVPGQRVTWQISNEGTAAVDVTLLFIDSEWTIAAAYPAPGQLLDNRLAPGKSFPLKAMVRGNTIGTEYLVAIAARARGPQRDFRCLAEPSLDAAQNLAAVVRGGEEDVLQSPLGRLMRYALYNVESLPGTTRGLASADADDCSLTLRAWIVKPD